MNHYIDIKINPDEEIPLTFIVNKVFAKLHKKLHDKNSRELGVSFPGYSKKNRSLGDVVRLHSSKPKLEQLQYNHMLGGLAGYCRISDILMVPQEKVIGYQTVSRYKQTMTRGKLKQRILYKKKAGLLNSQEEESEYRKQYIDTMFNRAKGVPYIDYSSISTGQNYRVYIVLGEIQEKDNQGKFDSFGLSEGGVIPVF